MKPIYIPPKKKEGEIDVVVQPPIEPIIDVVDPFPTPKEGEKITFEPVDRTSPDWIMLRSINDQLTDEEIDQEVRRGEAMVIKGRETYQKFKEQGLC